MNARYQFRGGLSPRQIGALHRGALRVIEKIGLDVPHQKILKLLAGRKGVSIKGTRVCFKGWLVDEATLKKPYVAPDPKDGTISTGVYCLNILDLEGRTRAAEYKDLVEMVKLADGLGMTGEAPVEPADLSPKLRQVAMMKACWEHSHSLRGGYLYDIDAAEYVYEMAQAAGKPFSLGGTVIISPLKVNPAMLDLFFHFRDRKVPVNMNNMPIIGVTAPIFYPAAYVQGMAEILAGVTLVKLIFNGAGGPGIVNIYPFDMKYQTVTFGSPEKMLLMLLNIQLARYFGFPPTPNALMCMAKEPDSQAAAEKMAQSLAAAAMGVTAFKYAGTLSQDEIFSAEQLLIDREIIGYVKRFAAGFDQAAGRDFLRLIEEGTRDGTFLSHPTTVENYRKACWFPELLEHETLGQWRGSGCRSIRARARETARKMISEHRFELPADTQRELNNIYRKAKQKLA